MFAKHNPLKSNHATAYRIDEHVSQAIRQAGFSRSLAYKSERLSMIQTQTTSLWPDLTKFGRRQDSLQNQVEKTKYRRQDAGGSLS